jgi:hypothetical protein
MKVFLAATSDKSFIPNITDSKYILESFYYFQEWQIPLIKKSEMFLLDSGAFTFMSGKKSNDFDSYLTRYIEFIKKHDVKYFFELDIDSVVGYDKVKQLRKRLEKETGKKCIPVWHKSRGKDEFLKMCDEYDYVAIGGIVTKEITKDQYPFFTWFLNEAHKRGCKVHGLGFTSIADLPKYHFDSVDSTSWKSGGRFGQLHIYKNGTIKTITQKSKRAVYRAIDTNNFNEWLKYQRYADKNL